LAALAWVSGCAVHGPVTGGASDPNPRSLPVEFHALPESKGVSVFYAILAHSNGKVYVGTCYRVAKLLEFDPKTAGFRVVATMSSQALHGGGPALANPTLLGDLGTNQWPATRWVHAQDKIHGQLHEGPGGRIYGATHVKVEDPNETRSYPGGHWFAYDPGSGATADLGWMRRHEGIITTCFDRKRNILYGVTWPTGYLVRCRPNEPQYAGRLQLMDTVSSQLDCSTRYFDVVDSGRVYVPDGATGAIRIYDPKSNRIVRVPGFSTPADGAEAEPAGKPFRGTGQWRNWWMSGTRSPDGMHIFLSSQRSSHLVEIDAGRGQWGTVIDHGPAAPWKDKGEWGSPHCGLMAFGRDGLLYYSAGDRILTFNRRTGEFMDCGRAVLASDGVSEIVLRGSASPGPDGRIYCLATAKKQPGVAILDPVAVRAARPTPWRVSQRQAASAGGVGAGPY
jgi:hypothetical protein